MTGVPDLVPSNLHPGVVLRSSQILRFHYKMGGLGQPVHRDELKLEAVLILCIFKSINVNLKLYIYQYHFITSSEVASPSPSFGGPRQATAQVSGRINTLTKGQFEGLANSPPRPRGPRSS